MGQGPNKADKSPEPPRTEFLFAPNSSGIASPSPDVADDEPPTQTATPRTPPTLHLPAPVVTPDSAGSGSTFETLGIGGELQPGQVILGKYVIVRKLGEGGMGTVWLVRHQHLNIQRALKLIVSGIAFDPQMRARFRQEAQIMAAFTHPNAVAVHDASVGSDAAYIDMEYVEGKSVASLLVPGVPMPIDWSARVLKQLCDVLQEAHDHRIVHRDLSPANLMLVDDRPIGKEFLKVLDFGIAKILNPEEGDPNVHTQTGCFVGKPQYTSPEQVEGDSVDGRSDLYSVGVILYEFLTGHRPFTGPPMRLFYDHCHVEPPRFSEKNPNGQVPAEVERAVMRCLAKNPDDRPQTARELAEEFLHALPRDLSRLAFPVPQLADFDSVDLPDTEPFTNFRTRKRLVPPGPPSALRKWTARLLAVAALGLVVAFAALKVREWITPRPPEGYHPAIGVAPVKGWPGVLVREKDGARFIRIAGGTFMMGGLGTSNRGPHDDQPKHPVSLSDYYLQETEVTNGEMVRYYEAHKIAKADRPRLWRKAYENLDKAEFDPEKYPAVGISHAMAEDFARWMGGRLPTEAQWEFAARSRGEDRLYVWGNDPPPNRKLANLDSLGESTMQLTLPVRSKPKDVTAQGIFDMLGNAREWCRDVWAPYPSNTEPIHNPEGPTSPGPKTPTSHVIRGGSYATFSDRVYTTGPRRPDPDDSTTKELTEDGTAQDLGFRIVIEWPTIP